MTAIETSSKNLHSTWTTERVTQLRNYVSAGLTCAQIAHEIGVSRNAVIGKINRLGLSRSRHKAEPRTHSDAPLRRRIFLRRPVLKALLHSEPITDDVLSAQPCSLLELGPRRCRWPIASGNPGAFTFCGNSTPDGISYCAGHARMAYRLSSTVRSCG
ncbi:MAG TPA: GcrA family cell cycle regulator [Pseudolabrys sp.]|nr:GcrA family cell cycle regulator [Pseudolabrys sp.]